MNDEVYVEIEKEKKTEHTAFKRTRMRNGEVIEVEVPLYYMKGQYYTKNEDVKIAALNRILGSAEEE